MKLSDMLATRVTRLALTSCDCPCVLPTLDHATECRGWRVSIQKDKSIMKLLLQNEIATQRNGSDDSQHDE